MKTQATTLLFLLATLHGWSQGTVTFQNDSGSLDSPPDRLIRIAFAEDPRNPFHTNYAPAVGTNLQVQLYYGASTAAQSGLVPVTSAPARLRGSTTFVPGTWANGGQRTLTGFDFGSGMVQLQVRVWDLIDGATYEQALINGRPVHASQAFLYQLPASPSDTGPALVMSNFVGFTLNSFNNPPVFFSGPSNQVVGLAETALLQAWVGGSTPLAYQWRRFGVDLPGKTANPLVISNTQPGQAGEYTLLVSNQYGTRTSSVATLTVVLPNLAIRQPAAASAEISWSTNLGSYKLQASSNLATWADHPDTPTRQGGSFVVSESPTTQQRFFRLLRP